MAGLGKTTPNLKLISKEGRGSSSRDGGSSRNGSLEIIALQALSGPERRRVERIVSGVCPESGVLGVVRGDSAWDLRPVVAMAGEAGPSLIRLLGPEVALSSSLTEEAARFFQATCSKKSFSTGNIAWGEFEGQLWLRRSIFSKTIAGLLAESTVPLAQVVKLSKGILSEIENWHSQGFVHGHVVSTNVALDTEGDVVLLDAAVAAFQHRAASSMDMGGGLHDASTFAPELCERGMLTPAADAFGLGLVLAELLKPLQHGRNSADHDEHEQIVQLQKVVQALGVLEPTARLALRRLARPLTEMDAVKRPERPVNKQIPVEKSESGTKKINAGRIVKVRTKAAESVAGKPAKEQRSFEQDGAKAAFAKSEKAAEPADKTPAAAPAPAPKAPTAEVEKSNSQSEPVAPLFEPAQHQPKQYIQYPYAPFGYPMQPVAFQPVPVIAPEFYQQQPGIPAAQPHFQAGPAPLAAEPVRVPGEKKGNGVFAVLMVVAAVMALFFVRSFLRAGEKESFSGGSSQDFKAAWDSMRPSLMLPVALAALNTDDPNPMAEAVIVSSAMKGEASAAGIDVGLIRVAFDKRWERQLKFEDRRAALALALSGLLQEKTPSDLSDLDTLHPGVILAVAASGGENVGRILARVPAALLTQLPPPIGPAMKELARASGKLNCGDSSLRALARLSTRGVDSPETIFNFLKQDTDRALRASAVLLSQDSTGARSLLDLLLNHPNLRLDQDQVNWGRAWDLLSWSEINSSDQLLILAGIPPVEEVSTQNLGKLFAHPVPAMRSYAIGHAINRIPLKHPAAFTVLQALREKPEALNPTQTLQLAQFLESPEKASVQTIRLWLDSNPPLDLTKQMLVATAKQQSATILDSELCRHLKLKGWNPDVETLKVLAVHPDELTRLFTYSKVYELSNQKLKVEILRQALNNEKNENYRSQIERMIASSSLF